MAASVYIIEYDTVNNRIQDMMKDADWFSRVVVSAEGHILTISHAAISNQVYQISFQGNELFQYGNS